MMAYAIMLFKLLIAHALCDFSLQTPPMASGKNRHNKPKDDAVPPGQKVVSIWFYWLGAHALIHAGGAWIATGRVEAAVAMLVSHFVIDAAKCENVTSPHSDQLLHLITMLGIAVWVTFGA